MFKKKLGFKSAPRTLEQINKSYNFNASQAGHKARIVKVILQEIETHEAAMARDDADAKALPKDPKPETPPEPEAA